jgi:hypothetical protein
MRLRTPALAAAITLALGASACGGDDDNGGSATAASGESMTTMDHTASKATSAEGGAKTAAADLRAGLTALLTEHTDLAGIAISTGLDKGLDSKAFAASAETLDDNSQALAKAIGSVYGDAAAKQFLKQWRAHIGFFVDYAKARASDDMEGMDEARSDLDGYRQQFGAFMAKANPNLTTKAVADELKPHVASVIAVIDAAADKSPDVYEKLREASGHMPMTASVLAGAIDEQKKLAGASDADGSKLRADLTHLLTDHVYFAGIAISSGAKPAAASLDENSKQLAEAIESVYGEEAGAQFLKLWRQHIGFFVDYTKAQAAGDREAAAEALAQLDGYREEFSRFLNGANPEIEAETTAASLQEHVKTLSSAIRAVVAKNPQTYDRLREAAQHMPMTAAYLAGAIAEQQKLG